MGCRFRCALLLGLMCLLALILIAERIPSRLVEVDAPPSDFSALRARTTLQRITQKPHPVGSQEHETVLNFLRSELKRLGLAVIDQRSNIALRMAGTDQSANVQNVLGILPGSEPDAKAVLLAAHYDSAPNSHGAGDDGAGVAALLETARALTAVPRLRRSIYFLFTDAEEVGMLGAQAFVQEHPLAHRVGFVLNFEARGTRGPVLMYQTSPNNGDVVSVFGRFARYPHANSLISRLSRILPNDTDASIFSRAGYSVLGFAFVEGLENYHQYTDSLENLDSRSLAHCGNLALSIAKNLGQASQLPRAISDAVYFDMAGRLLIYYPTGLARLFGALVAISWLVLLRRELRARRVTPNGVTRGVKLQLLAVAIALVVPVMLLLLRILMVDATCLLKNAPAYGWADFLVVTALNLLFYGSAIRQITLRELVIGGLSLSAMLSLLLGWFFPDASAPWQLITIVSLIVWRFEPLISSDRAMTKLAWQHLPLFFAALILGPVVMTAVSAASPSLMPIPLIIAATVAGLFLPTLLQREFPKLYLVSGTAGVVGFAWMLAVTLYTNTSRAGVRQDSLIYTYDADTRTAHYASLINGKDAWIEKWVKGETPASSLRGFSLGSEAWRQAMAPSYPLQPSRVSVQDLTASPPWRLVEVRIDPSESLRCVRLWQISGPAVTALGVNHKPVEPFVRYSPEFDELGMQIFAGQRAGHVWNLRHCGLGSAPIFVKLQVQGQPGIKLRLVEQRESLPEPMLHQMTPRPSGYVPGQESDETWIGQDIVL